MKRFEEKRDGVLTFADLRRPRAKIGYWIMFVMLLVVALICLIPPLWLFLSSFKTSTELMQIPPTLFPETFSLSKVVTIWKKQQFLKTYANTMILAAGSVVSAVVINGLAGYVLGCLKPKGSKTVFTIILWTMLMPTTLSMVPLYKNFISFPILGINLTNTFVPMWLCAGASAFNILLFKNAFESIPPSLLEAARLDGCGNVGIFTRIVLPLSLPIIMVVSIFTVNGTWGDFLLPYLVLTDSNKQTVMISIYKFSSALPLDERLMSLVFAILPPSILFFFFQKHIMSGATMGSIKE